MRRSLAEKDSIIVSNRQLISKLKKCIMKQKNEINTLINNISILKNILRDYNIPLPESITDVH